MSAPNFSTQPQVEQPESNPLLRPAVTLGRLFGLLEVAELWPEQLPKWIARMQEVKRDYQEGR